MGLFYCRAFFVRTFCYRAFFVAPFCANLFSLKLLSAEMAFPHPMDVHVSVVLTLLLESLSAAFLVAFVVLGKNAKIRRNGPYVLCRSSVKQ